MYTPWPRDDSYQAHTFWRKYLPFFPAHAHLTPDIPVEELGWEHDDLMVHLDLYPNPDATKRVFLLHGGGGHARLLSPIAVTLWRAGYEVIAPDNPGFGLTRAPTSKLRYETWVEVVVALLAAERARRPGPIVLFGLSLGGMLAYQAAARDGAVAGIIATTLADPRYRQVREEFSRFPSLTRLSDHVLPTISNLAPNVRVPIAALSKMREISNEPALTDVIMRDKLGAGRHVPIAMLEGIMSMTPTVEPEDFDVCPVLLAHPERDRWTTLESSARFFERLQCNKRLVLLERCGHVPIEEPGASQLAEAALEFLAQPITTTR